MEKQDKAAKGRMEMGLHARLQQRRSSKLTQLQELSDSVGKSFKEYRGQKPLKEENTEDATELINLSEVWTQTVCLQFQTNKE